MRSYLTSLIEVLGLGFIVYGAWHFDYRAGLIVIGLSLLLVGWALAQPPAVVLETDDEPDQ